MKFAPLNGSSTETSGCGQYELRPSYTDGAFAWRGRHVDSDTLIWSSADRSYVELCCARHADRALQEAT